jgi:tetratricopeptide (TPR) repeat protein
LLAVSVSGCATYVDRLAQASSYASAGSYDSAVAELNRSLGVGSAEQLPSQWGGDRPLAALERGSLQQALRRFESSSRDLSAAERELELLDFSTNAVGELGAYLYSDSLKTYRTPPTERLSLNAINLLNYVARGDLEGAAVEARRFQVMREYLSSLSIKTEAPASLGTYLAGFVFERRGEGDRALRYYEETLAARSLRSLDAPIARLAALHPYRGPQIREVLARQRGARVDSAPVSEILVVVSAGRVPHKVPERMPVGAAIGIGGVYVTGNIDWLKYGAAKFIVYPELVDTPSRLGAPVVTVDGSAAVTELVADLGGGIRREYEAAKPQIVAAALTRLAARAAVAEGVRAAGRQESSLLGDILSLLVESTLVALDRPDTRSWTMLPDRITVARVPVEPGSHTVAVSFDGSSAETIPVDVPAHGFAAAVVTAPR